MGKDTLDAVGQRETDPDQLGTMATRIENMERELSLGVDLKPIVDLVRYYGTSPNLALPLILSGWSLKVQEGNILTVFPTFFKTVIEATKYPLSKELERATTELVTSAVDKLIMQLQTERKFTINFAHDLLEKFISGDYATTIRSEQPEAMKCIRLKMASHGGKAAPLGDVLRLLKGEQIEEAPVKKEFPEPQAERGKYKKTV